MCRIRREQRRRNVITVRRDATLGGGEAVGDGHVRRTLTLRNDFVRIERYTCTENIFIVVFTIAV